MTFHGLAEILCFIPQNIYWICALDGLVRLLTSFLKNDSILTFIGTVYCKSFPGVIVLRRVSDCASSPGSFHKYSLPAGKWGLSSRSLNAFPALLMTWSTPLTGPQVPGSSRLVPHRGFPPIHSAHHPPQTYRASLVWYLLLDNHSMFPQS